MPEDLTDAPTKSDTTPRPLEVMAWLLAVAMIVAGLWLGPRAPVKPGLDSGPERPRLSLFRKH